MISLEVANREKLDPLWVFAYGSLMWNPGFEVEHSELATAIGYCRDFCIWSTEYRGTPEAPGLVLGLQEGDACVGMALRVPARCRLETIAYLDAREMTSENVYEPRAIILDLHSGERVHALAYVADPAHPRFASGLDANQRAKIILERHGERGSNLDYAMNTIAHVEELGVHDPHLAEILAAINQTA